MTPELPILYDEDETLSKPKLVAEVKPVAIIPRNERQDKQVA